MLIYKIPGILIITFSLLSGSAVYVALSQNAVFLPLVIAAAVITMAFFIFIGIFYETGRGGGVEDDIRMRASDSDAAR